MRAVDNEALWWLTKDSDRTCLQLFRRHYSCKNKQPRQDQFVGPGSHIVLRTDDGDAVFVWRAAEFRADKQEGIECSLFRNESSLLSSTLIRQADAIADHVWPDRRHYTFVDPEAVRGQQSGILLHCHWMATMRMVRKRQIDTRTPSSADRSRSGRMRGRQPREYPYCNSQFRVLRAAPCTPGKRKSLKVLGFSRILALPTGVEPVFSD